MQTQIHSLLPMVNPLGQLNLPTEWLQKLPPEQNQILRAKYGHARFCSMCEEEIDIWGDVMLLKISVITGWVLPTDKLMVVLQDQLKKKMKESYANCNPEEIEYAFRNFSSSVKDWGKQVNLNLIDEVMQPYLQLRWQQSFVEEQAALPAPIKAKKLTEFGRLRWLAEEIRYIRTGKPVDFVPHELYDYLDKRGKITATKEEKWAYFQKAIAYREIQLQKEWQDRSNTDNYNAVQGFRQMREMRRFTETEYEGLQRLSKKLLFFDLVQKQPDATRNARHYQPRA